MIKYLNKYFNDFFAFCYGADISGNPRRIRLGMKTMTNRDRQERMATNPHIPKRGSKNSDGAKGSHAQSHALDPTQQVYETQDIGYGHVEKHYVDGPEDPYFQTP